MEYKSEWHIFFMRVSNIPGPTLGKIPPHAETYVQFTARSPILSERVHMNTHDTVAHTLILRGKQRSNKLRECEKQWYVHGCVFLCEKI